MSKSRRAGKLKRNPPGYTDEYQYDGLFRAWQVDVAGEGYKMAMRVVAKFSSSARDKARYHLWLMGLGHSNIEARPGSVLRKENRDNRPPRLAEFPYQVRIMEKPVLRVACGRRNGIVKPGT